MEDQTILQAAEAPRPVAEIHFRLTETDYYNCMKSGRMFRHSGTRAWIETAVLTAIGAGYLFSYLFEKKQNSSLLLTIVCAAMIALIWILPEYSMHAAAKKQNSEKEWSTVVWPDRLQIGTGDGQWQILLDRTAYFWETDELFVAEDPEQRMTALPKCAMTAEVQEKVRAVLQNGAVAGVPKRRRR